MKYFQVEETYFYRIKMIKRGSKKNVREDRIKIQS